MDRITGIAKTEDCMLSNNCPNGYECENCKDYLSQYTAIFQIGRESRDEEIIQLTAEVKQLTKEIEDYEAILMKIESANHRLDKQNREMLEGLKYVRKFVSRIQNPSAIETIVDIIEKIEGDA